MTVTAPAPLLLAEVHVVTVERLSPTFARITLGSPALADFGVDGPLWDQRIKLVLPDPVTGCLASVGEADQAWPPTWWDRPPAERGHLRTYTVREVRGTGAATTVVVDVVLHLDGDLVGPGSLWAASAAPGDRVLLLGPRRGSAFGGIEFAPDPGAHLLLVGDETAVPAVCAVLEHLPEDAVGRAFLEVPVAADVQDVRRPPGVEVVWLAREGDDLGVGLHEAVVAHLGGAAGDEPADEVDPDLWETPTYSSSGEDLGGSSPAATRGTYAWIAGESAVVTALRRHLVGLGMDRRQVAFMGYWRRGVAMRS